jgi:CRP/FNR family cyclic AMP-dependent transcriptional regulator
MSLDVAAALAGIPLFALLDENERTILAERIDVVTHEAGEILFHRGEPGDSLYVLTKGKVEVFVTNDTGQELVLERPDAGDFFGEASLLDGGPRTASARVTEDIEALIVDRGDLDELFRLRPAAAMDMLTATGRRLRESARLLRHSASRNVNVAEDDTRTRTMKVADWISDFSGSIPFLMMHVVAFTVWIALNVRPISGTRMGGFDPFPFGLLTMVVSLEAIILSVFVLLSQNRQVARDHVRNDIEYEINLKAELEISSLHRRVETFQETTLARLERIERLLASSNGK